VPASEHCQGFSPEGLCYIKPMAGELIEEQHARSPGTLGDVLYRDKSRAPVSEKDWVAIVESIAAGDRRALDALFERTHRLVFTLIFRIVSNRQTAEEVTQDLYHDVWRHAARYDAANGSVLGWVMNQARSRAIDRLRFDQRKKRVEPSSDAALLVLDMPDYRDVLEVREQSRTLRHALSVLTQGEREAIESAFFGDSTYVEVAARLKQPLATIKTRIRSALHKLRQAMAEGSKETVSSPAQTKCDLTELVCAYAARALPAGEMLVAESHLPACWQCRRELEMLLPTIESFVFWPKDLLRPTASLLKRLAQRIAAQAGGESVLPPRQWSDPDWEEVASGISCKLLATDSEEHRVSMLVRLAPGAHYPPHIHAGVEELHLLDGELWIDDRKLHPGEYNRAEPGTGDKRVWSETGCTCVLVTSTQDALR